MAKAIRSPLYMITFTCFVSQFTLQLMKGIECRYVKYMLRIWSNIRKFLFWNWTTNSNGKRFNSCLMNKRCCLLRVGRWYGLSVCHYKQNIGNRRPIPSRWSKTMLTSISQCIRGVGGARHVGNSVNSIQNITLWLISFKIEIFHNSGCKGNNADLHVWASNIKLFYKVLHEAQLLPKMGSTFTSRRIQ